MCGRVVIAETLESIGNEYKAKFDIEQAAFFRGSFNIGPTQRLVVVNDDDSGDRVGRIMRFGLIPPYIRNLSDFKATTFNARAEGILTSKIYKAPFAKRRCLIIISGYYEWKKLDEKNKQPYYFYPKEGKTLALAGLWEKTKLNNPDGTTTDLESCTIITTEPNEVTAEYHDRMPVILHPNDHERWMNPSTPEPELLSMLKACPPDYLEIIKVDKRVGNSRNDGPENIQPIDEDTLF